MRRKEPPALSPRPPEPTLAALVRTQLGCSWGRARDVIDAGQVKVNGVVATDEAARVLPSSTVEVDLHAPRRRKGTLPAESIVYVDRDVVVVDKPADVLTLPYEEGDKDTLLERTRAALRRLGPKGFDPQLSVVHRLDKDTTGLLVFARNLDAKRHLSDLFRTHDVERSYYAIAHGVVRSGTVTSHLVSDRGDGLRGSHGVYRRATGGPPADAKRAITHFTAQSPLKGATLVECTLETGRQHQIRIHLAERGHPIVGERVYVRDYKDPRIEAGRPMLHARTLGFAHPTTGETVRFTREPPEDFEQLRASLAR